MEWKLKGVCVIHTWMAELVVLVSGAQASVLDQDKWQENWGVWSNMKLAGYLLILGH